ncbi:MAG: bifunctional diaminohydroxyphosphoribosylaminopyrimidine deaminase/5-amino-6-(5-phosphoribosylamino)uracil reductase RibD [Pirellulaceae bacterium]
MNRSNVDVHWMQIALSIAKQGEGLVEPNPMVGCVIVQEGTEIGRGWHRRFGSYHAEIEAIRNAKETVSGSTAYVTLEPCSHTGKTGPCTEALIDAGVARVVISCLDPFENRAGAGAERLRAAGVDVEIGVLEAEGQALIHPFQMLCVESRPWVIAKWAMSLDGKIATQLGESQWISSIESRELVHKWRGNVDAILVGAGTVSADDPLLTARPAGNRVATRIVLSSAGDLEKNSQLVRTAREIPLLVVSGPQIPVSNRKHLETCGAEVYVCKSSDSSLQLEELLQELGRRKMTNLLIEGGGTVLGSFLEADLIDEVRAFVCPKLIGGKDAASPIDGSGIGQLQLCPNLQMDSTEQIGVDLLVRAVRNRNQKYQ